ncbi:MAG TPA: hypothetical protein VJJ78_01005 [Candidatus Saccharimonadales bacterium]|nr:hypothetical protein [Candidatus Saccharimonadales bacterium]
MSKNAQLTGAFELFNKSLDVVRKNLEVFIILWIVPFLFAVTDSTSYRLDGSDKNVVDGASFGGISGLPTYSVVALVTFGVLFFVAAFVVSLIVQAMTFALELEAAKGRKPSLGSLWQAGKKYWLRLIGLFIVIALAVVAGLILLIVPGIIMVRRYFLAPYVMIDQDLGIMDAMRKSAELSKPHSGYIWSVIGVFILLSITSVIPVFGPIASFILFSLYSVAPALRYLELKKVT